MRNYSLKYAILSLLFPVKDWAGVLRTGRLQHLLHLQPGWKPQDILLQHPSSHHLEGVCGPQALLHWTSAQLEGARAREQTYSRCSDVLLAGLSPLLLLHRTSQHLDWVWSTAPVTQNITAPECSLVSSPSYTEHHRTWIESGLQHHCDEGYLRQRPWGSAFILNTFVAFCTHTLSAVGGTEWSLAPAINITAPRLSLFPGSCCTEHHLDWVVSSPRHTQYNDWTWNHFFSPCV